MGRNVVGQEGTFSAFNQRFYEAFDDATVFDCQDFNLLKVVQDGLKVRYGFRSYFGLPIMLLKGLQFLKRGKSWLKGDSGLFNSFPPAGLAGRPYLLLDAGRSLMDEVGKPVSTYFNRILSTLGRENCILGMHYARESQIEYDFAGKDYYWHVHLIPLRKEGGGLYQDLCSTFARIREQTRFSAPELQQIKCAFQRFWESYRLWHVLISRLDPRVCYFVCHHHFEGLILALNRTQVTAIELQHGLIAEANIFYIYPPKVRHVVSRALFPDKIFVYGDFWKDRLLGGVEYSPDQVDVLGYYLHENHQENEAFAKYIATKAAGGKQVILVTTQTDLHEYYIRYITWLAHDVANRQLKACIIVKTHPSEDPSLYAQLNDLPQTEVIQANLDDVLRAADIQVSIYSATLYEACRFGLANFSLNVDALADHVDAVVASGVAVRLEIDQNPLDLMEKNRQTVNANYFFSVYQEDKLLA